MPSCKAKKYLGVKGNGQSMWRDPNIRQVWIPPWRLTAGQVSHIYVFLQGAHGRILTPPGEPVTHQGGGGGLEEEGRVFSVTPWSRPQSESPVLWLQEEGVLAVG